MNIGATVGLIAAGAVLVRCGGDTYIWTDCEGDDTSLPDGDAIADSADDTVDAIEETVAEVDSDVPTDESGESNPCQTCNTNADCTGGLVCFDEDNNPGTPKVCTLPYVPADGCPPGMHGDFAVSKYCICEDCGGVVNPQCEPFTCLIIGAAAPVVGECKPSGDTCECAPIANPCQTCEDDGDCLGGLVCADADGNALTPKVCTELYVPAVGCRPGMHGDFAVSKYCICEDCGSVFNPRCEPLECLAVGAAGAFLGTCKLANGKCDCKPTQPVPNACDKCDTDAQCQGGLTCVDDDNNPATPTVCSRQYVPAVACPAGTYGDQAISDYCICDDCGSMINPKCMAIPCPLVGSTGVCKVVDARCVCEPGG